MLLRKKEDIENWLNTYKINNYELIPNEEYGYIINSNSTVHLGYKKLEKISVKFNEVNGNFYCNNNKLISLVGCPEVVNGDFFCGYNQLEILEGCPKVIKRNLMCNDNQLISLIGMPSVIDGNFNCSQNKLKSLDGAPELVYGYFDCSDNKLINLKYCPKIIEDFLDCSKNLLETLEGCAEILDNEFFAYENNITIEELKYLPKIKIDYLNLLDNEKLGDLQKISNFSELKEKLNIYYEKENLLNIINKEGLNKNNKCVNKI